MTVTNTVPKQNQTAKKEIKVIEAITSIYNLAGDIYNIDIINKTNKRSIEEYFNIVNNRKIKASINYSQALTKNLISELEKAEFEDEYKNVIDEMRQSLNHNNQLFKEILKKIEIEYFSKIIINYFKKNTINNSNYRALLETIQKTK
jgi:hypothetical protein